MAMEPNQVGKLEIPVEFVIDKKANEGKFKADVEAQAKQVGRRQAEVQAAEFVKTLEQLYQRQLGEAREELLRGLIDPKEFERRGREAAREMNKGILDELERRGKAGQIGVAYTEDFNVLTGGFKGIETTSGRASMGVGRLNETLTSTLRQAASISPAFAQVVNVIGSMALGTVMMTAVLAGLAALAWGWKKFSEGAREAKEEAEKALETLKALVKERERRIDPSAEARSAVKAGRAKLERIAQEIRNAEQAAEDARLRAARMGVEPGVAAAIDPALKEKYDEQARIVAEGEAELRRIENESQTSLASQRREMDELAVAAAEEAAAGAKKAREKAQQEVEKAADNLAAAEADLQKRLTALTATATDDLLLEIDRMEAKLRAAAEAAGKAVGEGTIAGLEALREDVMAAGRLEGLQDQLRDVLRLDDRAAQQRPLNDLIARLRVEIAALKEGSRARKEYIEFLQRAEDALKKNTEAIQKETDATKRESAAEVRRRRQEELQDLRERARLIEENARAALQLANALGLVSDEMMAVLENLAQLGGSVFRIASGDLTAIPSAIGAIAQLAKSAFGGKDAEALAQQLAENARQIRENTQALKDFREAALSGITGEERQGLVDFGRRVFEAMPKVLFGEVAKKDPLRAMDVLAAKMGVSVSELAGFFEQLERITGAEFFDAKKGITDLDEFGRAWQEFLEKGIGGFDETVGGAIDALRFKWAILGDAAGTAADRVAELIAVLKKTPESAGFADALAAALASGGAEAANALLDDLAKRLAGGDQTLFGEGGIFAGLNAEEVRRLLEEGNALLEDMLGGAGAGTTQDFVQARSITQVTGSRIEGALYTENVLSAERNALLRQLVAMQMSPSLVEGFVPGRVTPDMVGAGGGSGGGGLTLYIDRIIDGGVQIHAGAGSTIDEAAVQAQVSAVFERATSVLVEEVDRRLGSRYRDRQRTLGRS